MRPSVIEQVGTGSSVAYPLDHTASTYQVSLRTTVTGTATYSVEHTMENILAGEQATWREHDTIRDVTANMEGNYFFPVTAVRLTIQSGTGTVALRIVQQTGK